MTRWIKHVAVFAAWLGLGTVVLAQPGTYPSPVGATRIASPLSYTPDGPPPNLVPGGLTPEMAPIGPPQSLNLPANHNNAFQLECYPPEDAWFASAGAMGLMRGNLTRRTIAFLDNQNNRLDTGLTPVGRLTELFPLTRVHPTQQVGYRATTGYLWANEAVELTGFYIPDTTHDASVIDQGRIFVPFGPTGTFPIGFEGNNGLWLQADRLRVSYTGAVASAEANYRRWNSGLNNVELIMGLRYFHCQERIDIYTDDEFFVRDLFDQPSPVRQATYSTMARTNHVGVQMGGEYSAPFIPREGWNWLWFTGIAKSSIGANYIERSWRLVRGDRFAGFDVHRNTIRLGNVSEAGGYLDLHFLDRVRIRAGYTCIAGLGFSTAGAQLDFDLTNQGKRPADNGTIFWHGPVCEIQLLF